MDAYTMHPGAIDAMPTLIYFNILLLLFTPGVHTAPEFLEVLDPRVFGNTVIL